MLLYFLLFALPIAVLSFCSSNRRHHLHRSDALLFTQKRSDVDVILQQQRCSDYDNNTNPSSSVGLYVHIPYCRRRCNYCDFAIVPIGSNSSNERMKYGFERMDTNYRQALLSEIDIIRNTTQSKIHLQSIYFGGGTPSLAPLTTLNDIMHAIYKADDAPFHLDDDAEITIEMDPGTFNITYLEGIKQIGFNRISMGVQSFDNDILATMGRVHRSKDVYDSVEMIGNVFGEESASYSIDLISGVPDLSLALWSETLCKAVSLHPRPNHISCYDLQVEKDTRFGKQYPSAVSANEEEDDAPIKQSDHHPPLPSLPSSEDCAFMYSYASGYLRARGYEHYEISSYAYRISDGTSLYRSARSRHNQIYWAYNGQWYSIGLGATSNINGVRYARPRSLSDYATWTEELTTSQKYSISTKPPPWLHKEHDDEDPDDKKDNILDLVMTRLRTVEGLDLDWVDQHYGSAYVEAILRGFDLAIDLELGAMDDSDDDEKNRLNHHQRHGSIRLVDPTGFLFSNHIISNVFLELSESIL